MQILFGKILKSKGTKFLYYHFGAVLCFGILYLLSDFTEDMFNDFSVKYLNRPSSVDAAKGLAGGGKIVQSLVYWLWFALVTQSTLGYGGVIDSQGNSIPFYKNSYPFQFLNICQISSIFIISAYLF